MELNITRKTKATIEIESVLQAEMLQDALRCYLKDRRHSEDRWMKQPNADITWAKIESADTLLCSLNDAEGNGDFDYL